MFYNHLYNLNIFKLYKIKKFIIDQINKHNLHRKKKIIFFNLKLIDYFIC